MTSIRRQSFKQLEQYLEIVTSVEESITVKYQGFFSHFLGIT